MKSRVYTGKISACGCGRVHVDALGCMGHGGHTNKASRGYLWSCRSGLGCYGRGNFPGHDVLGLLAKMITYGWGWVRIGSDGGVCMHKQAGKQKRGKRRYKWANRVLFFNVCTCAENAARCQRWLWCSKRAKGRNKGQIRYVLYDSMHLSNGETGKQRESKVKAKGKTSTYKYGNPRPEMQQKSIPQN